MTIRIYRAKHGTKHDLGKTHPESPDRLFAIDDQLLASGLDMICEHADASAIAEPYLQLAHDPYYIKSVFERAAQANFSDEEKTVYSSDKRTVAWLDEDTGLMRHSLSAALESAGAGCNAVDWVMEGEDRQAFCATRPPGHHATYDSAMGFCFFNNIVIAARYALQNYDLKRVAIVDFDVHHGNGTEHIVAGDQRIMLLSSFQHPFYPHCGSPVSASNILAVPLEAGTTGEVFREKVGHWFNALNNFQPELILISAGFDAHAEDPMAHLRLVEDDYFWISQQLREVADKSCKGRIVSMLEGGYNLSALGRSVVAHLKGMSQPKTTE
ncbi:histone deacetylase family protein [Alteromonas sp. McT4-15]|uniref:histone deacetylase family protein n=1 Tax=Alteromonas sp. McT4-15 TaxID=2881256 RepID=UPI001CF87937|nr:histone deacetylase family protein [Alteromonas sp. McT4-15]MCB4435675.1 histone deacetylase family protein [Alteromonas sp. McT4-15]